MRAKLNKTEGFLIIVFKVLKWSDITLLRTCDTGVRYFIYALLTDSIQYPWFCYTLAAKDVYVYFIEDASYT